MATQIQTRFLSDKAITAAKLAADIKGNGLTGADGSALAILVDGTTLSVGSSGLKIADNAIGFGQLNADVIAGLAGETGIQGQTGVQGQTGLIGPTGLQGETGLTGAQGITGIQGQTGVQGVTGVFAYTYSFIDDFDQKILDTTARWTFQGVSGMSEPSLNGNYGQDAIGVCVLIADNDETGSLYMPYPGGNQITLSNIVPTVKFRTKPYTNTDMTFQMGFAQNGSLPIAPGNAGCCFDYRASDTPGNWRCCNSNGSQDQTTDTGIAMATDDPFKTFTIAWESGERVKYYIDGTEVASHGVTVPAETKEFQPYMYLAAADATMIVDYVKVLSSYYRGVE